MAKRYIGDAVVTITYHDAGDYRGTVSAGGHHWRFSGLEGPRAGFDFAYDSPKAYDKMAASAVSFGSYYTTHNRGADTPDWAPPAETADAISEAAGWAMDDRGEYEVRRSRSELSANPRRPPKQWMRDCVAGASKSARDPGAACGALWYHKMSPAQRRAALAREGKALANPKSDKNYRMGYEDGELDAKSREPPVYRQAPESNHYARGYIDGYRDTWAIRTPASIPMLANPSGATLAWVVGLAVAGGVALYYITRPSTAAAAEKPAPQPSQAPQAPKAQQPPAPAQSPNTAVGPLACTPVPFDQLGAFAKTKGYDIFYDEQTLDLTTKPPANPMFVNNPNAREYLTRLCSFFKWSGSQWIVDAVTDAELVAWLALSPQDKLFQQAHFAHGVPSLSSMFMV